MQGWIGLLVGSIVSVAAVVLLGQFAGGEPPAWEIDALLALNPERAPVLDELMLLVTDFSQPVFGGLFLIWLVGGALLLRDRVGADDLELWFPRLGLALSTGIVAASLLDPWEFPTVPWTASLLVVVAMLLLGDTFRGLRPEQYRVALRTFAACVLALVLAEVGEELVDLWTADRARPLRPDHAAWNEELRVLLDERVKRKSSSFPSGHATHGFAFAVPLMVVVRSGWGRAGLLGWAALHAVTRLYVGAHFPLCVVGGSVLGMGIGASVAFWLRSGLESGVDGPRLLPQLASSAGARASAVALRSGVVPDEAYAPPM